MNRPGQAYSTQNKHIAYNIISLIKYDIKLKVNVCKLTYYYYFFYNKSVKCETNYYNVYLLYEKNNNNFMCLILRND